MRRTVTVVVMALLALAMIPALLSPTASYASGQASRGEAVSAYPAYVGTLVATPSATLPATLLIQVGANTIAVGITSATQIEDASGNPLSPSSMVDGDTLQVSGTPDSLGQIDATLVQDISQNVSAPAPFQVKGMLAVAYNGVLCLQNANVSNGVLTPNVVVVNPCPGGDLPVYYTGSTTFENASGSPIPSSALAINDTLSASGTLSNGQFTASLVQDLTQAPVTTTTFQVTGTLAAAFNGVLCLQNANVSNGVLTPNVVVVNPCPGGDLPVYYTGSTTFENASGSPIPSSALAINDSLAAGGTLSSGQFTASLVQDQSQSTATTAAIQVTGTLAAAYSGVLCLQNANVSTGVYNSTAIIVNPCPGGDLPVYYTGSTIFENALGAPISSSALRINDSLAAGGTLSGGQFAASLVQDRSQSAAYYAPGNSTVAPSLQIAPMTLIGTIQSSNVSGRSHFITLRVMQGSMRGTYTINLPVNARIFSRTGGKLSFNALRKGETLAVSGVYDRRNHRWMTITRVQLH